MVDALAYFVSPHGFGHAARAAAVMNALGMRKPKVHFHIFTRVPRWFFVESLQVPFTYHACLTDIGLVQQNALEENLVQTLQRLQEFLPFRQSLISNLSTRISRLKCRAVLCDIAPLGIMVARAAGVPSILIENFTWDWIYAGYRHAEVRFEEYIRYLRRVFRTADYHIQTEPICAPRACDLVTRPVAREPRTSARTIRARLGIPSDARVVLITMGGIPQQHTFVDQLTQAASVYFVIPGHHRRAERRENVVLLPHRSAFYHPDLVHASDAVIGKAGYSTVAEAYRAGVPFGYISRPKFREARTIARFIETEMHGFEISADDFENGRWIARVDDLLALPRLTRDEPNGATQIAMFLHNILERL